MSQLRVRVIDSVDAVSPVAWNALAGTAYPFFRHEFLAALERHGCVGREYGWLPCHVLAEHPDGELAGAVPMYRKYNSYGEFVFDWSWAQAYQRAGLRYYPKLVATAPYTPASGPRLLISGDSAAGRESVAGLLIDAALEAAGQSEVSSLHWLFTSGDDTRRLRERGFLLRLGCQFHWQNAGYRDFDDYLDTFSADKRKKIKRERRRVRDAGVELRIKLGHEVTDSEWETYHALYCDTFDKRGGVPTLSSGFFKEIARTMGEQIVLVIATHAGRIVAMAFNVLGRDTLYGRHWGCSAEFHSLHFEACYYQGLQFCIDRGIRRFEPGAQGEHKVSRGFLPSRTWSAHWIRDPDFRRAIANFLKHETEAMEAYIGEMNQRSPYKLR